MIRTWSPWSWKRSVRDAPLQRYFVCHYHEIGLKKNNRAFFENRLLRNIEKALLGLPFVRVRRISGRLIIELGPDPPVEEIGLRLQKVFGLSSCAPAWLSSQDLESLQENLWQLVRSMKFETFKIHARRAHKDFPLTSQQLNQELGAFLLHQSGKRVQLEDPDLTCYLEIVEKYAFLYFDRLKGPGGLPVSSSGKVVVLLSGGIDSPVASYKIMKRGCQAIFAHFHSHPYTTLESQEKVRQLVSILDEYQYGSRLYLIPFAECQRQIVALTPAETRVILYRRLMMRLAERVAFKEGAQALVTGESIGQVASQTLENLRAISRVTHLPVLRPLVGEDKEEIICLARRIGTFEVSILPDSDCCSLFVPRHPETRARTEDIDRIEGQLDVERMMQETFQRAELEKLGSRSKQARKAI